MSVVVLDVSAPLPVLLIVPEVSVPVLSAEVSDWFCIVESADAPVDDCDVSQEVMPMPAMRIAKRMVLFIIYFLMFLLLVSSYQHKGKQVSCQLMQQLPELMQTEADHPYIHIVIK